MLILNSWRKWYFLYNVIIKGGKKGMEFKFVTVVWCRDGEWFVWFWLWGRILCTEGFRCGSVVLTNSVVSKVFAVDKITFKGSTPGWRMESEELAARSVAEVWFLDVHWDYVDRSAFLQAFCICICSLLHLRSSSICFGVLSLLPGALFSWLCFLRSLFVIQGIVYESFSNSVNLP